MGLLDDTAPARPQPTARPPLFSFKLLGLPASYGRTPPRGGLTETHEDLYARISLLQRENSSLWNALTSKHDCATQRAIQAESMLDAVIAHIGGWGLRQ